LVAVAVQVVIRADLTQVEVVVVVIMEVVVVKTIIHQQVEVDRVMWAESLVQH
jgi:hypothetical protein